MSQDSSRFLKGYSRNVTILDFYAARKLTSRGYRTGSNTTTTQPERRGRGVMV